MNYWKGLSGMNRPDEKQVQLTVFGPGYGESILVHLGSNNWVIIDSCENIESEETPATLNYLEKIGVDASEAVKLIVVSHWHQDHTVGLTSTLQKCSSAGFVLPNIFTSYEFLCLLNAQKHSKDSDFKYISNELFSCINLINERNRKRGENERSFLRYASEDKQIWQKDAIYFSHNREVRIMALSPSDFQYQKFLGRIERYRKNEDKKSPLGDNDLSMAIQINVGDFSILLGSDVPTKNNIDFGWKCIINNIRNNSNKSRIYKVAHHGSEGSDAGDIWELLLNETRYSVVTPWKLANRVLPKPDDLRRIEKMSTKSFITNGQYGNINNEYPKTLKFINGISKNFFESDKNECGFVTFTVDLDSNLIDFNLGNGAKELNNFQK